MRSPRHSWKWHACFLAGLAISALGGLIIEQYRLPQSCGGTGLLLASGCATYLLEEPLEFLGIWLALVAMLGHYSRVMPPSSRKHARLLYFLPLLWTIPVTLPSLIAAAEFRSQNEANALRYASSLTLHIHQLDHDDTAFTLQFFAIPDALDHFTDFGYSLHLVDQVNGSSVASIDQSASISHLVSHPAIGAANTYQQRLTLNIPPGRYDLFTGLYRLSGLERLPATDAAGNPFTHDRVPIGHITVNS